MSMMLWPLSLAKQAIWVSLARVASKETRTRLVNYRKNREFLHPDDGTSERVRTNNELAIIQDPSTRTPICCQG